MKKIIIKELSKNRSKSPRPKTINRFWGLAARFKQCHIGRIKSKKK